MQDFLFIPCIILRTRGLQKMVANITKFIRERNFSLHLSFFSISSSFLFVGTINSSNFFQNPQNLPLIFPEINIFQILKEILV